MFQGAVACRTGRSASACGARPARRRIGPIQPAGPGLSFAEIGTRLEPQPAALRVEPMRRAIGTVAEGRVYVSGQVAINHDLQPVFDADLQRGEEIAIPIAIVVLLIVFGTASATLVPLLMAAGTVPVTLGLLWILAHELNMAIYVTNLVTLIGIAIAIDYSLLVVYRYREELVGGAEEQEALRITMRTAGTPCCSPARRWRSGSPASCSSRCPSSARWASAGCSFRSSPSSRR